VGNRTECAEEATVLFETPRSGGEFTVAGARREEFPGDVSAGAPLGGTFSGERESAKIFTRRSWVKFLIVGFT